VALAEGKHLFPFRTEKLSPPAPMVLPGRLGGRVGRRPLYSAEPRPGDRTGLLRFWAIPWCRGIPPRGGWSYRFTALRAAGPRRPSVVRSPRRAGSSTAEALRGVQGPRLLLPEVRVLGCTSRGSRAVRTVPLGSPRLAAKLRSSDAGWRNLKEDSPMSGICRGACRGTGRATFPVRVRTCGLAQCLRCPRGTFRRFA
jgi:hypothetical protein